MGAHNLASGSKVALLHQRHPQPKVRLGVVRLLLDRHLYGNWSRSFRIGRDLYWRGNLIGTDLGWLALCSSFSIAVYAGIGAICSEPSGHLGGIKIQIDLG